MGAAPTIDALLIAYREPKLGALVRAWLPHAQRVIVVLGGTREVAKMGLPAACPQTLSSVRAVADPDRQIVIVPPPGGKHWQTKNTMAAAAYDHVRADLVWSVDADETYFADDIERARTELGATDRWELAGFPHIVFWKSVKHVLRRPDGRTDYMSPGRIWRRRDGARHEHLPFGRVREADGRVREVGTRRLDWGRCYHAAFIGDARVRFRVQFHESRARHFGGDPPMPGWLDRVWARGERPARGVHPSLPGLTPVAYAGRVPPVLREIVG